MTIESFQKFFSVVPADTPDLQDEVYKIRYDVYCKEFGYEPAGNFPDEKECDGYDAQSKHCLVVHKPSGFPAGCVRLVPTDLTDPSAPLPFEQYCGDSLDQKRLEELQFSRSSVCEISRLAVRREFRRRAGESESRYGHIQTFGFAPEEQRTFPYIAVSLYLAATVLTELTERQNVFAMMEPFLPRLLGRAGITFTQVGKVVDYHGQRAAYFITTDSALQNMQPELRQLYDFIRASIVASIEPPP